MDEATARAMIQAHFDASNVGAAGGRPGDDIARASEIYADDAVLEWPQGGEHVRGKAIIIGFRSTYPARQHFELHRTTGCHDVWINEYTIRYDDRPVMVVGTMEFRDGNVVRERIYFGDPWEPPAWRAQWSSGSTPERTLLSRRPATRAPVPLSFAGYRANQGTDQCRPRVREVRRNAILDLMTSGRTPSRNVETR